jgi:UDPglucose--hexose-1-phosphate uridylyltransferase
LAGASVEHPHSQIAALPIIPPDVSKSIEGGISFFKKHGKCVHCAMLEREIKEDKRIIFKNNYFITVNPYASKVQYETRIFPLKHNSNFEEISDDELLFLAQALKDALVKLGKALKNPDYNFFIHTASARVKNASDYHWHLEILPHTYKWAGLELGSGIEAITVSPEKATEKMLKYKK